jgi:hypothetical protein
MHKIFKSSIFYSYFKIYKIWAADDQKLDFFQQLFLNFKLGLRESSSIIIKMKNENKNNIVVKAVRTQANRMAAQSPTTNLLPPYFFES